MSSSDVSNVAEKCRQMVEQHFQAHPFNHHALALDRFVAPEGGLLADFLRTDLKAPVPKDPWGSNSTNDNIPSLLLHDLENPEHIEKEVYQFIEKNKDVCTGLYATSGAGKTRSIFEYLSRNFGLYFVASTQNDAGSIDLERLIDNFENLCMRNHLENLSPAAQGQNSLTSHRNYAAMKHFVYIMLWVRRVVFDAIQTELKKTKNDLTPYQWLLIQLFPGRAFAGVDLFHQVTLAGIMVQDDGSIFMAMAETPPVWNIMVVDEAQVLLNQLGMYFLSSDSKEIRYAFSAVLKALNAAALSHGERTQENNKGFPLFSGTGLALEDFMEQSRSVVAKRSLYEEREYVFQNLKPLTQDHVKAYILSFLNLDQHQDQGSNHISNSSALEHVAKWLRGRPRWAASFLEVYLVREKNKRRLRQDTRKLFICRGQAGGSAGQVSRRAHQLQ